MRVNFYATLRQVTGAKTVEFPLPGGTTLRQLVAEIVRCYPALQHELLDENGELYQHVHVLVNGRDAPYLDDAMETKVAAEDVVSVFPAVGGG